MRMITGITAVIIEDDLFSARMLQEHLSEFSDEFQMKLEIEVLLDPMECLERPKAYDIYFIKIEMQRLSGIELVKRLRGKQIDSEFVFVSAYDQFMRPAIFAKPSAFVRKTFLKEDLRETMSVLRRSFEKKDIIVTVQDCQRSVLIRPEKILYMESEGHYVNFYSSDGDRPFVRNSLGKLTEQLAGFNFLRIHMRYAVNLNYVAGCRQCKVILEDGRQLPVSVTYKKDAVEQIEEWLVRKA